jgi:hypothetical protein
MSYFIQSYGKGFIQRNGDKYGVVLNQEVAGSYVSIEKLVHYNPVSDGKQASTVDEKAKKNLFQRVLLQPRRRSQPKSRLLPLAIRCPHALIAAWGHCLIQK